MRGLIDDTTAAIVFALKGAGNYDPRKNIHIQYRVWFKHGTGTCPLCDCEVQANWKHIGCAVCGWSFPEPAFWDWLRYRLTGKAPERLALALASNLIAGIERRMLRFRNEDTCPKCNTVVTRHPIIGERGTLQSFNYRCDGCNQMVVLPNLAERDDYALMNWIVTGFLTRKFAIKENGLV